MINDLYFARREKKEFFPPPPRIPAPILSVWWWWNMYIFLNHNYMHNRTKKIISYIKIDLKKKIYQWLSQIINYIRIIRKNFWPTNQPTNRWVKINKWKIKYKLSIEINISNMRDSVGVGVRERNQNKNPKKKR